MGPGSLGTNKLVVIVDYGMGNLRSVFKAFEYLGCKVVITHDQKEIERADYLVLPGVGAFGDGMENLKQFGLVETLKEEVILKKKPFLGICLGLQLLARDSEEFGFHQGLGWIEASVKKIEPEDKKIKIPHVGWNALKIKDEKCPLFQGIKQDSCFYFVHSYHLVSDSERYVKATSDYGQEFTAAIQKENIFAVQFHPEKSQMIGLRLLENFISWEE